MQPLPVFVVVNTAIRGVACNLRGFAVTAGPWMVLVLSLSSIGTGFELPAAATVPIALLNVLGMFVVAVAWHRHVIDGEYLTWSMAIPYLRVVVYAFWAIVVQLLGFLAILLALILNVMLGYGLMAEHGWELSGRHAVQLGLELVAFWLFEYSAAALLYLTVTSRLMLVLPAIAIGDHSMTLRRSWDLTRGNTFRLIGMVTLLGTWVTVGFVLGSMLAAIAAAPSVGGAATLLLVLLLTYLNVAGAASLLSAVYLRLAGPGDRTGAQLSPLAA